MRLARQGDSENASAAGQSREARVGADGEKRHQGPLEGPACLCGRSHWRTLSREAGASDTSGCETM